MTGSRVAQFEKIRRDAQREDVSIRELARRHGVGRATVRQALACSVPPERKTPVRRAPKLEPVKVHIDAMLLSDVAAPRKQRHTARRVLARLVDEHGAQDLTYSAVRDYVARRRPGSAAEASVHVEKAFVLQTRLPGAEAEIDFGDVYGMLAGELTKSFLFTLRLSASGKACHPVFAFQGQEAFIEGHVDAFNRLGGVPYDKVRYDNLKSAVTRVLFGRGRDESDRWVAFARTWVSTRSTADLAWSARMRKVVWKVKSAVSAATTSPPVLVVATLARLNARIRAADMADDARRIDIRVHTVGQDFAVEAPSLRPLPRDDFDAGLWLTPRVDRYARVTVRQCHYSVPASLVGRTVRVSLRASQLVICDGRREVARHPRLTRKGAQSLTLDHYLEVLVRKPGALPGATALVQARESGVFTAAHEAFWGSAREAHGDFVGTRALIEVLLLHRHLPHADVVAALDLVVRVGGATADVVAVEARKLARLRPDHTVPAEEPPAARRVGSLTERRLLDPAAVVAGLPPDTRPLPSVAAYDEPLPRRTAATATTSTQGTVS